MSRGKEHGFTLIELVTVVSIVSLLLELSVPFGLHFIRNARAAQILEDFTTVRAAALLYNADTNAWPAEADAGVTPGMLVPYLPRGFSFTRSSYTLDWENWVLPEGTPRYPATKILVAVSLSTADPELGRAVMNLLAWNSVWYTMGDRYTFLIVGT